MMETKKKFTLKDIPGGYAMCTRNDCKVCNHCLRHIAYNDVGKDLKRLMIVNPLLVEPNEQCEHFRTDELATYARGFVKMKQEMLPRQYDEFMIRLIGRFGRTGYYERRRGQRLCSPPEIEFIRKVLQEIGLPDLEFDGYEQQYNWCD
jgi:hypothetical protein